MNEEELKALIKCIHTLYYNGELIKDPILFLKFHRHLQELFNFADITETLVVNNPNDVSPEMVEFGIKHGWIRKGE